MVSVLTFRSARRALLRVMPRVCVLPSEISHQPHNNHTPSDREDTASERCTPSVHPYIRHRRDVSIPALRTRTFWLRTYMRGCTLRTFILRTYRCEPTRHVPPYIAMLRTPVG